MGNELRFPRVFIYELSPRAAITWLELAKGVKNPLSVRDLCRKLRAPAKRILGALRELQKAGLVIHVGQGNLYTVKHKKLVRESSQKINSCFVTNPEKFFSKNTSKTELGDFLYNLIFEILNPPKKGCKKTFGPPFGGGREACAPAHTRTRDLAHFDSFEISEIGLTEETHFRETSSWFNEKVLRRLLRRSRGPISTAEYKSARKVEIESLKYAWIGYYLKFGPDPFLRTLEFCDVYTKLWRKFIPRVPITGNRGVLNNESYADSHSWPKLLEGRRRADFFGAKYRDWCFAIFDDYRRNGLPNNILPTPPFFATDRAAKVYSEFFMQKYRGKIRICAEVRDADFLSQDDPVYLAYEAKILEEAKMAASEYQITLKKALEEVFRQGGLLRIPPKTKR